MGGELDETIKPWYVPDRESRTVRIEVLNPRYVPESEYKSVIERFEKVVKERQLPSPKRNGLP